MGAYYVFYSKDTGPNAKKSLTILEIWYDKVVRRLENHQQAAATHVSSLVKVTSDCLALNKGKSYHYCWKATSVRLYVSLM